MPNSGAKMLKEYVHIVFCMYTVARGCHGRFLKKLKVESGRKQLRIEELVETWLRRRKPT
jgi:hypothetical protein